MPRKTKLVEVTLKVRVPDYMTAAQVKAEIAGQWYGELYASAPTERDTFHQVTLRPRWGAARVVKGS